jgi:hypothetical protein
MRACWSLRKSQLPLFTLWQPIAVAAPARAVPNANCRRVNFVFRPALGIGYLARED